MLRNHTADAKPRDRRNAVVTAEPEDVLEYWFGAGDAKPNFKLWFQADKQVDEEIARRFGPTVEEALQGGLREWETAPRPMLAKMIVLDQFARNMYRKTARAFAGDAEALRLAKALDQDRPRGIDPLTPYMQAFVVIPFGHSEVLADHKQGAALVDYTIALARERGAAPEELSTLAAFKAFHDKHTAIIEQFGRYPHRNEVFGRATRPDEDEYLKTAERFGQ